VRIPLYEADEPVWIPTNLTAASNNLILRMKEILKNKENKENNKKQQPTCNIAAHLHKKTARANLPSCRHHRLLRHARPSHH
jgi:hypothetical protein